MTRSTSEEALIHLLETIKFVSKDHVQKAIALEGIVDIIDLFANSPHSYEYFEYATNEGTHTPIHKADRGKLVMLHLFYIHRQQKGEDVSEEFWLKMDKQTYDTFHVSQEARILLLLLEKKQLETSYTPSTNTKTSPNINARDKVAEFRRGKRDISIYPVLKDEKYWDEYHITLVANAKVHECQNVLDPLICTS